MRSFSFSSELSNALLRLIAQHSQVKSTVEPTIELNIKLTVKPTVEPTIKLTIKPVVDIYDPS